MKIGIDISQLAFPGTGVAAYTESLITNLLKIDKENENIKAELSAIKASIKYNQVSNG